MAKAQKTIEIIANVAIIAVAIVLGYVLIKQFVFPTAAPPAPGAPKPPEIGTKISLPETDFATSEKTLVVALKKGCRFCTESAAFYQKLTRAAGEKNIRVIAVFPHSIEEGQGYLKELNVTIPEIKQADLNTLQVSGTPTLILADKSGQITKAWLGKLPPDKETEVINSL